MKRSVAARWLGCVCLAAAAVLRAADAPKRFDLAGGPAADVLAEFADAAHLQLLFPTAAVREVKLPALHGEFTVHDALDRLLADSGLEALRDDGTGSFAVRRRVASATVSTTKRPSSPGRVLAEEPPPLEMPAVHIEQRRDFGLTTQSILRADPAAPIYHFVANRADIETSGVTNMAEFVTTLPGFSGEGAEALQSTADLTFQGGANVHAGSYLKLRGWDAQHTAVLLNGRPLPVSPELRGPDLSRIPLAAVERIEVMPFAGSALYGNGAVGGAMNIVLRKDFAGESVSTQIGDSTHGGGRELFFTWIEGLSSADGRTRATIIGDYQRRGALRLGERDFLSRAVAQLPPARLLPGGGVRGLDLRNILGAELAGYPSVFAVTAAPLTLGLPGAPAAQFAVAPAGRDAATLDPTAFTATDPTTLDTRRQDRVVLRSPMESFNFNVQFEHTVAPDRLEFYAEFGFSRGSERFAAPDAIEPLTLSAFDPRNPFRNGVRPGFAGEDVTLFFDPVDLPDAHFSQTRDSLRAVLGARGAFSERWHWVLDGFTDLSRSQADVQSYGASLNALLRAWSPLTSNALAAVYNPLADHRLAPVAEATRERYLRQSAWLDYHSRLAGADLRVAGPVFELPAGPLRVSLAAEYAWHQLATRQQAAASRELYTLIGDPRTFDTLTQLQTSDDRGHRIGGVAEAIVPVWHGQKRGWLSPSAELDLASRLDRSEKEAPAWSNLAALKLAPSSAWALRGTISQGHVTPESSLVHGPMVETLATVTVRDPLRGGGLQTYPLHIVQGGSQALRAETSEARVIGLTFTPASLPGFFLSLDHWSISMHNRLRAPTVQEMVDHAEYFPGKIERGAPLPWEFLLGWAGPVTKVDLRPVHVTRLWSHGLDVTFRYRLPPLRPGTFTLLGHLETVQRYDEQFLPATPPIDKIDTVADGSSGGLMEAAVVSPRARLTLGWQRGPWSATVGMSYTPPYRTESTTPTAALPAATGLDGDLIGSSTRWDLQAGYTVSGRREPGLRGWLAGTTWTLGVRNVFDTEPPYRSDGTSFYSRFDDPRMRFVYLRAQWRR